MTFMPDLPNAIPRHDFQNEDGWAFVGREAHPGYERRMCRVCGDRFWASTGVHPPHCGKPPCTPREER